MLLLSACLKFAEIAAYAEDVGFRYWRYRDCVVVASYVAFHALCASVKGGVTDEVDLGGADALAFVVVFFAASCTVAYSVVFAVFWAAVHNALLRVHLWLYERIQRGSKVYDSSDGAEFVAPEPSFFEADENRHDRENEEL